MKKRHPGHYGHHGIQRVESGPQVVVRPVSPIVASPSPVIEYSINDSICEDP